MRRMSNQGECEMWSKTRQVLESRLAEDLKGRVRYQYDVYRNGYNQQAMSIMVDLGLLPIHCFGRRCTRYILILKTRKSY